MDPISAMIGAGASLIGGFMNTSSQQAINTANIQEAQWSAQGGYLPGLVANANRAGISPLAVLGMHAPSMPQMISGDPGSGLQNAGRLLAQMDPNKQAADEMALKLGQANVERVRAETSQTKVDTAKNQMMLDVLHQGGDILNQLNAGVKRFADDYNKATSVSWRDVYNYLFGSSPQQQIVIPRTLRRGETVTGGQAVSP